MPKKTSGEDKNWWSAREAHTSVAFEGKIWVIGGKGHNNTALGDVWSSADGKSWTEESAQDGANVDWGNIYSHASTVFNGKIWVTGGVSSEGARNSIWSSADGRSWDKGKPLDSNVLSARMVDYGNRLYIFGQAKFWSSTNPDDLNTDWKAENTLLESISYTQAVVFKNKIWLLGGIYGDGSEKIPNEIDRDKRTQNVWSMGPGE